MVVGKALFEIAKVVIKKHGRNLLSAESNVITKFPPNLRPVASTILKGAQIVTYGGIVSDVIKVLMQAPDSPGNGVSSPFVKNVPSTYKQNKARYRQSVYNNRRYSSQRRSGQYNRHPNACCCQQCRNR